MNTNVPLNLKFQNSLLERVFFVKYTIRHKIWKKHTFSDKLQTSTITILLNLS